MKKCLWLVSIILVCVLALTGCNTKETEGMETTSYKDVNNLADITIAIKDGTLSHGSLTLILANNSGKQCIYGEYYSLEQKVKDQWYQLPVVIEGNYGFNDIAYDLSSGKNSEWTVDWKWLYGTLGKGEYRLVKDILVPNNPEKYDTYYFAVEFSL